MDRSRFDSIGALGVARHDKKDGEEMVLKMRKNRKRIRDAAARAAKTTASFVVAAAMVATMMPATMAFAVEPAQEPEAVQDDAARTIDEQRSALGEESVPVPDQQASVPEEAPDQEQPLSQETVEGADAQELEPVEDEEPAFAPLEFTNPAFSGGSGTASSPYLISTAEDLVALSQAVAAEHSYAGEHFKLTADIDATGSGFTPIGYFYNVSGMPFAGVFDGDGHSITLNMTVSDKSGVALFGYAAGPSANAPAKISNVTVEGSITASGTSSSKTGLYGAGIVGLAENVEIDGCVNEADIVGYQYIGGIVGSSSLDFFSECSYVSITNCANKGDVSSTNNGGPAREGGLIGHAGVTVKPSVIKNSYNVGRVIGDNMMGGLLGYLYITSKKGDNGEAKLITIENCYHAGLVKNKTTGDIAKNMAALIGSSEIIYDSNEGNIPTIKNCHALEGSCVTSQGAKEALYGYMSDRADTADCGFESSEVMQSYDFVEMMGSGYIQDDGYPILRAEKPLAPVIGRLTSAGIDSLSRCVVGRNVTLQANASTPGGQGTLSYAWYKSTDDVLDPAGDTKLPSTSSSITASESSPCTVYYYCVATNTVGSASVSLKSAPTKVVWFEQIPIATPSITSQPIDGRAGQDQAPYTLSVSVNTAATGIGDVTYQWYECTSADSKDGAVAVEGATSSTYAAPTDYAGAYHYYCKVTNTFNVETTTTDSNIATVTIDPTVISTPDDLIALSERVSGYSSLTYSAESLEGKTFVLGNDINMSGHSTFRPIGSYAKYINGSVSEHPFKGTFDGQGHTISGISLSHGYVNYDGYTGVFGYVIDATIKNLSVVGSVDDSKYSYIGGIVGYAKSACVFENLSFEGSVSGNTSVGGIIGYMQGTSDGYASIKSCLSRASVTAVSRGGGIAGSASNVSITSCYNWGAVTVNSQSGYAGGIAGSAGYYLGSNNASINACYNIGTVKDDYPTSYGSNPYVGGIVGDGFGASSYPNYYLEGSAPGQQGAPANAVVAKTSTEMRAPAFLALINAGITPSPYIANELGGYPLLSWEAQSSATHVTLTIAPDGAADATVTLIDGNGTPCFELVDPTLASNKRKFALYAGTYTLSLSRYGYQDVSQTIVVNDGDADKDITVTMQQSPSATVGFSLSAQDGASTAGARMWLKSEKHGWIHQGDEISAISGFDASSGSYAGIPAGEYTYAFVLDDHQSVKGSFTVGATGQAVSQNVSFAVPSRWDGTGSEPVATADGTYVVTNGNELAWISSHVNGGDPYTSFEVVADIILNDADTSTPWESIGTDTWPYAGVFDGHGHMISGIYYDGTDDLQGLFGAAEGAVFKNVIVSGSIRTTGDYAAGLVAYVQGNASIENIGNHVDVQARSYVGGIVASVNQVGSSGYAEVKKCYNKGSLIASEKNWSENNCIGGIAGESRNSNYDTFKITSCYNLGTVNGGAVGAGGILGTGGVALESCFNVGEVILGTYGEVYQNTSGALIGWLPSYGSTVTTRNVYYLEGSSPRPFGYVGAVPAQTATVFRSASDMANPTSKGLLDFAASSGSFNSGYPHLSWESTSLVVPDKPGLPGSEENPYIISTAEELIAFSQAVRAGNTYAGSYVALANDIDLTAYSSSFDPIGDYEGKHAFEGNFNGNGHAVKGLDIHRVSANFSDAGSGIGLFGYTRHATITRVEVTGNISGSNWVGGVVGYAYDTHVTNCLSRVNVSIASDADAEGNYGAGVVGQSYSSAEGSGSVVSCVYYGKVTHPANKIWGAIATLGSSSSTVKANYYLSTQNSQGTEKDGGTGTTGVKSFDDRVISWYLNTADGTIENTLIWGNKIGEGVMFANGDDVIATYRIIMDQTPAFITADPEFIVKGDTSTVTIQQMKKGYSLNGTAKVRYSSNKEPEKTIDISGHDLPYSFNVQAIDADMYVSADYSFDQNTLFDLRANVFDASGNAFASGAQVVFLNAQGVEVTQAKRGDKVVALVKTLDADSQYRDASAASHYGSGAFQSSEDLDIDMVAYGRAFELIVGDADVDFSLVLEPKGTPPEQRDATLEFETSAFHIGNDAYSRSGEYLDHDLIIDGDADSGVTETYYDVYYDPYPAQDVLTVASIENSPKAMRYSQHYSFLDSDGTRSSGVYTGIDIGSYLVRYCSLNPNLPDGTQVAFIDSDGKKVTLTIGELREPQRNSYCIADDASGYAKQGDFTARGVPVMLASSKDGVPFSFEQGGPLKLVVGQKSFDDENGGYILDDVRKIVIGNDASIDTSMHDSAPFSSHLDDCVLVDIYRNDELVEEGARITLRDIEEHMKNDPSSRESVWANVSRYSDGGVWSGYGDEPDHYQGVNIWSILQDKLDLTEYDLAYEGATATFCEEPFQGNNRYTPVATTSLRYLAGGEDGSYSGNTVTYSGRVASGVPAQLTTSKNGLPLTKYSNEQGTVSDAYNFRGPIMAMLPVNPAEGVVQHQEVIDGGYGTNAYAVGFLGKIILHLGEAADKGPLQELHDTAASFTDVTVSADGSGTADDELWIDPFSMQLLQEALANARSVLDDNKAGKDDVDAAYLQLNTAFDSFISALQYGSALSPASLSVAKGSFMGAVRSNGETVGSTDLSTAVDYSGDGEIKVWSNDPNIAEASYDRATKKVTVKPKGAGTTTINVFAAPSSTYAGAGAKITVDSASVSYKGGSLRIDDASKVDPASLRMGYEIGLPEGYEATWQWKSSSNAAMSNSIVTKGNNYLKGRNGTLVSNIVFTGVHAADFDTQIYTQMSLVITKNGTEVLRFDDTPHSRSVDQVAQAVVESDKEPASAKEHAQKILDA